MKINGVEINLEILAVKYDDNKVLMINEVKKTAGIGLKEAKKIVEDYLSGNLNN